MVIQVQVTGKEFHFLKQEPDILSASFNKKETPLSFGFAY